jgi:hypothetical protein
MMVLILQLEQDQIDDGFEPMAMVLMPNGTFTWQWVGNLKPLK